MRKKLFAKVICMFLSISVLVAILPLSAYADALDIDTPIEGGVDEETQEAEVASAEFYNYTDAIGIESYDVLLTTEHSATASCINLSSGMLTSIVSLVAATTPCMAYDISLVFNSTMAGEKHSIYFDRYNQKVLAADGWKLSICERILETSEWNYLYEDADGTVHTLDFYGDCYVSKNGQFTLTKIEYEGVEDFLLSVVDKSFTTKIFRPADFCTENPCEWVLYAIVDVHGNQITISPQPEGVTAIYYTPVGTEDSTLLFNIFYRSTPLNETDRTPISCIANEDFTEAVIFRYVTSNNNLLLTQLDYVKRETSAPKFPFTDFLLSENNNQGILLCERIKLSYDDNRISQIYTPISNQKTNFEWNDNKVVGVYEEAENTKGQEIVIEYTEDYTDVRTGGSDDKIDDPNATNNNHDDIITRYINTYSGRIVAYYSFFANSKDIISYTELDYSDQNCSKNGITSKVAINGGDENLIKNSDFEQGDTGWFINGNGNTANITDLTLGKSFYISGNQGTIDQSVGQTVVINTANEDIENKFKDYIVGAYVNIYDALGGSNFEISLNVCIGYLKNSTDIIEEKRKNIVFEPINEGWMYRAFSFSTAFAEMTDDYIGVKYIKVTMVVKNLISGRIYFDDLSLYELGIGQNEQYIYDDNGNIVSYHSYDNDVYYCYDDSKRLVKVFSSSGAFEEYIYEDDSNVLLKKIIGTFTGDYLPQNENPESCIQKYVKNTYVYTYGSNQMLTRERVYAGDETSVYTESVYEYTTLSNGKVAVHSVTDSLGSNIVFYYDDYGKLLAEISASKWYGICYNYDSYGRLESVQGAGFISETDYNAIVGEENVIYTYNDKNQLSQISTDSTEYIFAYDAFGNVTSVSVGVNTIVSYEYNDNNGKLISITYANGHSVTYKYDILDNISEVWYNINGTHTKVYSYEYSTAGRLIKSINHISATTQIYEYDAYGKISDFVCVDNSHSIYSITPTYDVCSRVSRLDYTVGNVSFSQGYQYNNQGVMVSESTVTPYTMGGVTYTYDNFDRITTKVIEQNSIGVTSGFKNTVSYTYKTVSNETSPYVSSYTSCVENANGTTSTSTYSYLYDSNGYIIRITKGSDVIHYEYDMYGQLVYEKRGIYEYTYTYDDAGNIVQIAKKDTTAGSGGGIIIKVKPGLPTIQTVYTDFGYTNTEWGDLLTSFKGVTITYDSIGNPLSYYNGSNYSFTWQGRQLVGAVKGTSTMSFAYDADGLRTSKTVNGVTTNYYYTAGLLLAEETPAGITVYIYDAYGSPIGFIYRGFDYADGVADTCWFEKNLQGDIVAVYNTNGTRLASYSYDVWGVCTTTYANGGASTSATKNNLRYRGYYLDSDLGLYYLQSRYYDPNTCRFISPDSVSYLGADGGITSYNLYTYCGSNPVNYSDPNGHSVILAMLIGAGVGLVVGLGSQLVSDIIYNVVKSGFDFTKWEMSSWQTYVGAGLGGAIGGAFTPFLGPITTAFITGISSTAISMGLSNVTGASDYTLGEIVDNSLQVGLMSAVTAGALDNIRIPGVNAGRGSLTAISKQINTKLVNGIIKNVSLKTISKMAILNAIYSSPFTLFNGLCRNGIVVTPD